MPEIKNIQLKGRVFITFDIEAVTGLHIGGSDTGIEIGGVDKTVIRDPITNRPYIPGSSLKGKVRSLLEKYRGLPQNQRIGQGSIHSCNDKDIYANCDVCQIFGVPGERKFATPTRLVVRDVHLSDVSATTLEERAHAATPSIEQACIPGIEIMHACRQIWLDSAEKEMEMVAHQNPGEHSPIRPGCRAIEQSQPVLSITVAFDNVSPLPAARRHMIEPVFDFDSQWS